MEGLTAGNRVLTLAVMDAIEFTAELSETATLVIPPEIAVRLPKVGRVRVIVLSDEDAGAGAEWQAASYEQFLADDSPEDAIYESLR